MNTRSLLAAALVAIAPSAYAADVSGIYQIPYTSEYLSVHEKNGTVILSYYYSSATAVVRQLNNGQTFSPPRVDNWDLLSGTISSGVARISGETVFGACIGSYEIDFNVPRFKLLGMVPSTVGFGQRIDCAAVYATIVGRVGNTFPLVKVY